MVNGISFANMHYIATSGGRMSVPVEPASLLYSNFQHVAGIPAPEGIHGVSIPGLHLLDVLIAQLNRMGQRLSFESANPNNDIDALIDATRNQILETNSAPYGPETGVQTGILFDLSS